MKSYRVYIVSCSDKSYYIGVTNNIEKRMQEHNYGIDPSCYTYKRRPVSWVYSEEYHDIYDAITREKQLKKRTRKKKDALIKGDLKGLQKYASSGHGSTSSPGQ